jgi:beta-lactamase class A
VNEGRMTIRELAEASVTVSDNTAANLLLDRVGGPAGLTEFLRAHGDNTTRLDRNEPLLNLNDPGDQRDTTSPRSMVESMRSVLLGSVLSPASREHLLSWMVASRTGTERIRAGLPKTWRAGDKTGTGNRGAFNDVAILWPPNSTPILVAVYMSDSTSSPSELSAAHAQIGRLVASRVGK